MLRIFSVTFFLFLFLSCSAQPVLKEVEDFGPDPGNLQMYIHAPKKEDGLQKPLLVALHGCNQNADEMAQRSGWNKLADRKGFYVLYPQQRFRNNLSSCFNWYRDEDRRKQNGELASIRHMIRYMVRHYPIDRSRVYLYGMSAGGAMGVTLLAYYPGLFQSGAIYASLPYHGKLNAFKGLGEMGIPLNRSPEELGKLVLEASPGYEGPYPRLITIHGEKDLLVSPRNSREMVEQWTWVHGIDAEPDSVDKAYRGVETVERSVYTDESGKVRVIRYSIAGIGHRIAIDPGDGPRQGGEVNIAAKDMDFHSTYWIGRDMGLFDKE